MKTMTHTEAQKRLWHKQKRGNRLQVRTPLGGIIARNGCVFYPGQTRRQGHEARAQRFQQ